MRTLCLHGHFYQPPREHPWLGVVEPERSAAPFRDWNARITAECYRPNAAARILDPRGRLRAVVNAYAWTSFNFGPTLLGWLVANAPDVVEALRDADAASRARTGYGNAWAQAYGHAILPLSTPRDVRTQVIWGRREFELRFGRAPDGMWLPEMAVDATTLVALADAGITLTMLSPHQALRIRPLGGQAWQPVTAETLDTRRVYRWLAPRGRYVDVVFRDDGLSRDVAFGPLLADGATFARRLADAVADGPDALVTIAVDGETYGHHHRFGEMALAFALRALAAEREVVLAGPAAFRAQHSPTHEVEVAERTSWSCVHGVERWRAACGCRVGGPDGWSQEWRRPLRTAIDWLRDELASFYEATAGDVLRDPWGARDRYVDCLLEPTRGADWLAREAARPLGADAARHARRLLELARHALLMQTSCGWFFDELAGIEPVQVLRYAARAIELAETFGRRYEEGFVERLAPARSNRPGHESGAALYRRAARRAAATPARVGATAAMLALLGADPAVPGYDVDLRPARREGEIAGDVSVGERATDTVTSVRIRARRTAEGVRTARADDVEFTLADLFGVQREAVLDRLAREAGAGALGVLDRLDARLAPLLAGETSVPAELAALLGWREAHAIAAALTDGSAPLPELVARAAASRRRGAAFPSGWLGPRVARVLEDRLGALPASASDALTLLDLARAADLRVDLGPAQVIALRWWNAAAPAVEPGDPLAVLRERLAIAPEAR